MPCLAASPDASAPLVTALITNYNHGRYLATAIDSALAQTYPRVEVLVVDDGSTDGSRTILAGYGSRVRSVLQANGGQAAAFNAGIQHARGSIVCLLDADDAWSADKVEVVVRDGFARTPEAALVYHRFAFVDGNGAALGGRPQPRRLTAGHLAPMLSRSGGWWTYPPTSALAFRTDVLRRMAPVPPQQFRICADAYLADLAPFLGDVVALEPALADYRLHDANNWNHRRRLDGDPAVLGRNLEQYAFRVDALNASLQRLGLAQRVSLDDHWPYWRTRALAGERVAYVTLARTALGFAAEPRRAKRFKELAVTSLTLIRRRLTGKAERSATTVADH